MEHDVCSPIWFEDEQVWYADCTCDNWWYESADEEEVEMAVDQHSIETQNSDDVQATFSISNSTNATTSPIIYNFTSANTSTT